MAVWTSSGFFGSILGYIVPSFFIYSENVQDSPWGWCFITPALITFITAALAFFFLVEGILKDNCIILKQQEDKPD